ncbi:MAG: hypothetical protein K8R74_14395 [Bacteroidales bacterium]|nr:hypothetical protein [Bacteroidales bacterium]
MKNIIQYLIVTLLAFSLINCEKEENEPNDNPPHNSGKYDVSYINDTPSSAFEFWAEYDFDRKILLDASEIHTDLQIDSGEYKLEYKYYTDAGLIYHRTGYFYLIKNDTIDFFDDLYNVEDGGIH